jgi:hypothetical protein
VIDCLEGLNSSDSQASYFPNRSFHNITSFPKTKSPLLISIVAHPYLSINIKTTIKPKKMSRLFNCFSQPTASAPTSRSSDFLRPPHPDTPSQSFHSAPTLSSQHRNNGYENLTQHFTQSENAIRERRRGEEGRLRVLHHRGEERGGRVGEGKDFAAARNLEPTRGGEKEVGSKFKEEFRDDVSELRLDRDAEGGRGEKEARVVTVTRIQPVGVVAAGVQGERARQVERAQRWMGRGRDYCTLEERRRVEGWIAGCERAGCRGFVRRVRLATGGSGENSSGGHSSGDGGDNDNRDEGAVRLRGGGLAPGWPEWGRGWGAYKFMS